MLSNARCLLFESHGVVRQVVGSGSPGGCKVSQEVRPRSQVQSWGQPEALGKREVEGRADRQTVRPSRPWKRILPAEPPGEQQDAPHEFVKGAKTVKHFQEDARHASQPHEKNKKIIALFIQYMCANLGFAIRIKKGHDEATFA